MLALSFLFPLVLWGAAGAALPVIIHLIMRTKPRKQVFPALRFVRKTHQANLSKLRLKHLILLAMRMLLIVLVAALLARAEIPNYRSVIDRELPVAAVIVLDDSGSMGYRLQRRTLLAGAKETARRIIALLPERSRVAVLTTSGGHGSGGFHSDLRLAEQAVDEATETVSHTGLSGALGRASAMLAEGDLPRKAVYVLTDMTAQSWRDAPPMHGAEDVEFAILNLGDREAANRALLAPQLPAAFVPRGVEAVLQTVVTGARLGGEVRVVAELAGRPEDSKTVAVPADGGAPVDFTVRPREEGIAHGRIVLEQEDFLDMDNVRYFSLRVGSPPAALIVREGTSVGAGDETSRLMALAISPPGRGAWIRRKMVTSRALETVTLKDYRMVVLADVASLPESQWVQLARYVEDGGRLWVVAGPLLSVASYNLPEAQRVLPASLRPPEALAEPVRLADPTRHPMLLPFVGRENPPLSQLSFFRRFGIEATGIAAGADVVLRYRDGVPAILTRSVGHGRVVFWNFSPARAFSDLAPAAQFPVLALRTAQQLASEPGDRTLYTYGGVIALPLPRDMRNPEITVRRPSRPRGEPASADLRARALVLTADELGPWEVEFLEGARKEAFGFSVNADPAESDLTPVQRERVEALFRPDRLTIADSLDELRRAERTVSQPLDLAPALLLGLLVLLTAESFFANRFYRTPQQDTPGAPAAR